MMEPLPALSGDVRPEGSPVDWKASRAALVVRPMSKHRPVLLRWPYFHHRT